MDKQKLLALCLILLLILGLRFLIFFKNSRTYHDGDTVSFTTTLLSQPQVSGRFQRFSIDLPDSFHQQVFISIPLFPSLSYGDSIAISGSVKSQVLKGRTIYTLEKAHVDLKNEAPNPLLAVAKGFRSRVIGLFAQTLPPQESSLLLGIVFGIKENMPADFTNSLRTTGVLHVIAASGMNVTMVAGFLTIIFGTLFKRQVGIVLSLFGLLFYAVLAGLEPSILRASVMAGFAFGAQLLGRQTLSVFFLFLTGFVLLVYRPDLVFDVGFQLSFLSTAGILLVKPIVDRLKSFRAFRFIGDDIATTTAAQIATLPIMFATFGQYGLVSILVNALVLWTIPILMVLGGVGALVGLVFGGLGKIFLLLSLPFLIFFEKVVTFFGEKGFVLSVANLPGAIIFAYYLFIVAIVLYRKEKK
ncbi:MAG TPA: ComEC/Rec2 family competence protein [Candidatus Saccharimonadales bacterium]|nr:ComEC/Rec2 family competence protein [Candidatus Saccharimonadales bacterium]